MKLENQSLKRKPNENKKSELPLELWGIIVKIEHSGKTVDIPIQCGNLSVIWERDWKNRETITVEINEGPFEGFKLGGILMLKPCYSKPIMGDMEIEELQKIIGLDLYRRPTLIESFPMKECTKGHCGQCEHYHRHFSFSNEMYCCLTTAVCKNEYCYCSRFEPIKSDETTDDKNLTTFAKKEVPKR